MNRKPQPKQAAALVRSFLKAQGMELSNRKALDVVAIVEGFANYQTMKALQAVAPEVSPVVAETPYDSCWAKVLPTLKEKMEAIVQGLQPGSLISPVQVTQDDENAVRFEFNSVDGNHTFAQFYLFEDDAQVGVGRFCLRFTVEDLDGVELQSWYSGPRYTESLWADAEELIERVAESFSVQEVLGKINVGSRS